MNINVINLLFFGDSVCFVVSLLDCQFGGQIRFYSLPLNFLVPAVDPYIVVFNKFSYLNVFRGLQILFD